MARHFLIHRLNAAGQPVFLSGGDQVSIPNDFTQRFIARRFFGYTVIWFLNGTKQGIPKSDPCDPFHLSNIISNIFKTHQPERAQTFSPCLYF